MLNPLKMQILQKMTKATTMTKMRTLTVHAKAALHAFARLFLLKICLNSFTLSSRTPALSLCW